MNLSFTSEIRDCLDLFGTQNLVISRCCFAEEGKEMFQELQRTCTAIVLLIKPFVKRRCRLRRGFLDPQKRRFNIKPLSVRIAIYFRALQPADIYKI